MIDIHGMAVTSHGRAGASYTAQLNRAFDRFSRRHEHDPVSWTAPTRATQWQQRLSVSFWNATIAAYSPKIDAWVRKASRLGSEPPVARNVFCH